MCAAMFMGYSFQQFYEVYLIMSCNALHLIIRLVLVEEYVLQFLSKKAVPRNRYKCKFNEYNTIISIPKVELFLCK